MNERENETGPELVTPATIELLLRGAKALVIVVYVVVIITFAMLTLGFFLHLAGASPEATFVDWVYRNTERAMEPFRGMFPVRDIDDRSVFDASLLFAAALYGFIAIGLHAVVEYLSAKARRYHRQAMNAVPATEPTPTSTTPTPTTPTPTTPTPTTPTSTTPASPRGTTEPVESSADTAAPSGRNAPVD